MGVGDIRFAGFGGNECERTARTDCLRVSYETYHIPVVGSGFFPFECFNVECWVRIGDGRILYFIHALVLGRMYFL